MYGVNIGKVNDDLLKGLNIKLCSCSAVNNLVYCGYEITAKKFLERIDADIP